jgi:hypothetical protein
LEVRPNAGVVGSVGVKGFIGGFADSRMPDFGERLPRGVRGDLAERLMARGTYRNRHALQTGDVEMGRRNCTFRARKLRDQVLP